MELFTELEFNENEFDKIDDIRLKLKNDGWIEIDKIEHTVIGLKKVGIIKSVIYKWAMQYPEHNECPFRFIDPLRFMNPFHFIKDNNSVL